MDFNWTLVYILWFSKNVQIPKEKKKETLNLHQICPSEFEANGVRAYKKEKESPDA